MEEWQESVLRRYENLRPLIKGHRHVFVTDSGPCEQWCGIQPKTPKAKFVNDTIKLVYDMYKDMGTMVINMCWHMEPVPPELEGGGLDYRNNMGRKYGSRSSPKA